MVDDIPSDQSLDDEALFGNFGRSPQLLDFFLHPKWKRAAPIPR
jgi:hypothetical protein